MLTDTQLDDVKAKLEDGKELAEIIEEGYPGEPVMKARRDLVEKFGRAEIQQLLMMARISKLSVDQLSQRIDALEERLNAIKAVRDAKL